MNSVRHHFVPQGFLRGFAANDDQSDKMIWVYDKRPGRRPRYASVKAIAWAPAYYAQENADGSPDTDTVETNLARTIDNEIPRILASIVPTIGRPVALPPDVRGRLAFFIGLSLTRVPSYRDGIEAMYARSAELVLPVALKSVPKPESLPDNVELQVVVKPWVSLRPMVEAASRIAESALAKQWQFFVPPPTVPLVTSDNPVVFSGAAVGVKGLGPAHPAAELLINLRKDLALVCTLPKPSPDMQVFRLTPSDARKFNRGVVRAARHRVFADHQSEIMDSFVKKYAGMEQRLVVQ